MTAPTQDAVTDVVLARQPIFDADLRIKAFELLYRAVGEEGLPQHPSKATATVLVAALTDVGLERLVGDQRAFINVNREFPGAPGAEDDRGFTVGLFSIADALLHTPLLQLLDDLPFDDRVTGALLDHSGPEGRILGAALAYERGHFSAVAEHHDLAAFGQTYYDAVAWATEMVVELR